MIKIFDQLNFALRLPGVNNAAWSKAFMVSAFLSAASLCILYAYLLQRSAATQRRLLQRFYGGQALLLLGLALNKQTDFLNRLTTAGRIMALREGWYAGRNAVQFDMLVGIAIAGLLLLVLIGWYFRPILRHHWLPLMSAIGLLSYVAMRAISLHAVDAIIAQRVLGLRWDWLFEVGGLFFLMSALALSFEWRRQP